MSSEDVLREVLRLRDEGWSIRAIADELGLSKSTVHRIILAVAEDDDGDALDDDLDERERALDAADDGEAVPPFQFVGRELVILEWPGCDPEPAWEDRFVDATGRSVSTLDIYRARMGLEEAGQYAESAAISADLARQIERAGR